MLLQELVGRGSTDGIFRRQRFFETEEDSGMFVAINRIRACDDPRQFLDYEPVYTPEPDTLLSDPRTLQQKEDVNQPPLVLGDRVVWMSDYGPEHGVVRWVGFLHDTREREWTVGVEFVSIYITLHICTRNLVHTRFRKYHFVSVKRTCIERHYEINRRVGMLPSVQLS